MNHEIVQQLAADTFSLGAMSIMALALSAAAALTPATARGQIFVTGRSGTIGEYNLDGTTVNASLVSGLPTLSYALAISSSDMFVSNADNKMIGEYTTSGGTVNADLVSGLDGPNGIAVVVPEPSTLSVLAAGAAGLLAFRPRRSQARA
jgi:hypothetical protein